MYVDTKKPTDIKVLFLLLLLLFRWTENPGVQLGILEILKHSLLKRINLRQEQYNNKEIFIIKKLPKTLRYIMLL